MVAATLDWLMSACAAVGPSLEFVTCICGLGRVGECIYHGKLLTPLAAGLKRHNPKLASLYQIYHTPEPQISTAPAPNTCNIR